jgi:hypothetical protein
MHLAGTPSDLLPDVIATGQSDIGFAFISLSAREPNRRDAAYLEWHSLDHRPEQHRLPELRSSLRLVSTPECRAVRAVSHSEFDQVDHAMTYLFTSEEGIPGFNQLGAALAAGGRMPLRLPSVGYLTGELVGKSAASASVAGADVLPWRPAMGVYLLIEEGHASPVSLLEEPGVAGLWWYHGRPAPAPYQADATGRQITYCYLDRDPVDVGRSLEARLQKRWSDCGITALLAAPFFSVVPYEWTRHLPH